MEHSSISHKGTLIHRRHILQMMVAFGTVLAGGRLDRHNAFAREIQFSSEPTARLDQLTAAAAASPGKRAQLAGLSEFERSHLLSLLSGDTWSTPDQTEHSIVRSGTWGIGRLPNYTTAIPAEAPTGPAICAACYGSEAVFHVAISGQVRVFSTGRGTHPLDVAYDRFRHRLVVASADGDARMIVIDLVRPGEIVHSMALAPLTGQGISQGGIQGVTVDIAGDYWLALSYFGIRDGGVLVKLDGRTLQPTLIVKDAGMNNPNGLVTGFGGKLLFAMSDNGSVQEFDLGGSRLRTHQSLSYGYRGIVSGHMLWVSGWLTAGRMVRINLLSGERREFPCVPLANSVAIDSNGLVWVAGDAGVSVSNAGGKLLAQSTFGAFTNGLSVLDNAVYFVSYDEHVNEARTVRPLVYIPAVHSPTTIATQ